MAMLLERDVDVNARQQGGWTALHSAVNRGDCSLVALLLDHGAEPELANDTGQTAVSLAQERGLLDVARLLGAVSG